MSSAGLVPYREILTRSLPRLLSLLDRDPFSPTFGCFDRPFWHYKTCTDFPSAIYQQGLLPLVLLYKHDVPDCPLHGSPWVLDAARAAMRFWAGLQNRDGSFNEWYPGEHSHVATAFTAYAVSEALLTLDEDVPGDDRDRIVEALTRAARWLARYVDREVLNHSAGALAALYNIHLLTEDPRIAKGVDAYVEIVKQGQDEEGWFREYGGADVGYQGVTLDYLAKYFERSGDERVAGSIERGLGFLSRFVYPDGTCGGPIGSRSTRYLLPHGLELLRDRWDAAGGILEGLGRGLAHGTAIGPEQVDDRYFTFFFFPNLVQACVCSEMKGVEKRESRIEPLRTSPGPSRDYLPESGLLAVREGLYTLVCNVKKGGVMRIHAGETTLFSDAGYFGELFDGRVVSTNWLNPRARVNQGEDGSLSVSTRFVRIDYSYPLKMLLIPFRLFNITAGRFGALMWAFNRMLKSRRIAPSRVEPIEFVRSVRTAPEGVTIRDEIRPEEQVRFRRLRRLDDASTSHVPTSRYWVKDESLGCSREPDYAEALSATSPIVLERRITVEEGRANIEVFCNGRSLKDDMNPQIVSRTHPRQT